MQRLSKWAFCNWKWLYCSSFFSQWYWVSWEKDKKKRIELLARGSPLYNDFTGITGMGFASALPCSHALTLVKPLPQALPLAVQWEIVCLGIPWSFELVGIQAITHSDWFLNLFVIGTPFFLLQVVPFFC
jgi:hypothetical protein